jgi:hypothetical protein
MTRQVTFAYKESNKTILISVTGCPDVAYYISNALNQNMRVWSKVDCCWAILPEALAEVVANVAVSPNVENIHYKPLPDIYKDVVVSMLRKFGRKNYSEPTTPISSSARDTLFVAKDAPDEVIKAAYKALAKKYHPDSENGSNTRFLEIRAAYDKLLVKS